MQKRGGERQRERRWSEGEKQRVRQTQARDKNSKAWKSKHTSFFFKHLNHGKLNFETSGFLTFVSCTSRNKIYSRELQKLSMTDLLRKGWKDTVIMI